MPELVRGIYMYVLVHNGAVLANNKAVLVKPVETKMEAA
jgi:hypothetical protein